MWDIPVYSILYVDYGNPVDFWISAMASIWGRGESWLVFCAADRRLKTNPRTPISLLTDYYWACPWVPKATRAPKFDIFGTLWSISREVDLIFWKKKFFFVWLWRNRQIGYFGIIFFSEVANLWIFNCGNLHIDHKVPYMSNLGPRVASGTHGHAR